MPTQTCSKICLLSILGPVKSTVSTITPHYKLPLLQTEPPQLPSLPCRCGLKTPRDWDSKYHNKHPLSLRLRLLGILQQQQENQLVTQSIKHPLIHSDKLIDSRGQGRVGGSSSEEVSMTGEDMIS